MSPSKGCQVKPDPYSVSSPSGGMTIGFIGWLPRFGAAAGAERRAVARRDPFDDELVELPVELAVDEREELRPVRLDERGDPLLDVNGDCRLGHALECLTARTMLSARTSVSGASAPARGALASEPPAGRSAADARDGRLATRRRRTRVPNACRTPGRGGPGDRRSHAIANVGFLVAMRVSAPLAVTRRHSPDRAARSVTPEVAGSSPVAPASSLQNTCQSACYVARRGANNCRLSCYPA
jgi:hypothetical protein